MAAWEFTGMGVERESDGHATARKQLRLLVARGEFAEARSMRMMRSCATAAAEVRESGGDQALIDSHLVRTRTMLEAERLLQSTYPAEVDLGAALSRYATHFLIGSETMTELRTSAGCVLVDGEVCRWVMMVAAELLHAVEATGHPSFGCSASVVVEHLDHGIVLSVIAHDAQKRPVPRRSGADAIARASRVMKLVGGFVTSVCGSDVVHEATFRGGRVSAGS